MVRQVDCVQNPGILAKLKLSGVVLNASVDDISAK